MSKAEDVSTMSQKEEKKGALAGQVALVTGGAWGIGRACARRLAREGAKVTVADLDLAGAEQLAAELRDQGGEVLPLQLDVRESGAVRDAFQRTLDSWGRLDILVNVAGVYPTRWVLDMSDEEWDLVIDTNLRGTFLCDREAARIMVARGTQGRIVNIGSSAGQSGRSGKSHYCASKAGVLLLTKTLAMELAEHEILVNAVLPGLVVTERKQAVLDSNPMERRLHEAKMRDLPLGRCPTADEVASAVFFLVTPEAGHITGQALAVDGGSSAGRFFPRVES